MDIKDVKEARKKFRWANPWYFVLDLFFGWFLEAIIMVVLKPFFDKYEKQGIEYKRQREMKKNKQSQ